MRTHHLLLAALLALPAPALVAAAPATAPLSVREFFDNPHFSGAKLSPHGDYLAIRVTHGERRSLAVLNLATGETRIVGAFKDAHVGAFDWVNDNRLIMTATQGNVADGDRWYGNGLYAINRDGSDFKPLVSRTGDTYNNGRRELLPIGTVVLNQRGKQDSEFIYVLRPFAGGPGKLQYVDLLRLNTLNGQATVIPRPGASMGWLLDNNDEPRIATTVKDGVTTVHYRDPARNQEWRALVSFDAYAGGKDAFTPLAFGPDGTLYVVSNAGQDQSAVYTYDLAANKIADKPLVRLDGYDFNGRLLMGKNKLAGIRYLTESVDTTWLDPDAQALQKKVDELLPNTINQITPPPQALGGRWVLVEAYSDVFPLRTMLYDRENGKLSEVGSAHPGIDAARMGHEKLVHYKARDGLDIPAWLTLPPGQKGQNLPMVLLVHGGPFMRGNSWGWDAEAQFLASRGYAVLEPEFRGSTGFGASHFHAGWKQWGLKMQDDLADGTRWAIGQGIADPGRICIAGGSYGGYAALMGAARDADLYRCAIDWAGVTDLNLLYESGWLANSDSSELWRQYGLPKLVGDQVKDAEQLKAGSPLYQAARIKQPLLLAYGGADLRVPLEHGVKFYDAVRQGNPDVEWIEYPAEGHGWVVPENRYDFWHRVEVFLHQHIGKGAGQP